MGVHSADVLVAVIRLRVCVSVYGDLLHAIMRLAARERLR